MGLSFRVWTLVERLFATSFNTLHPILALMGQCPPGGSRSRDVKDSNSVVRAFRLTHHAQARCPSGWIFRCQELARAAAVVVCGCLPVPADDENDLRPAGEAQAADPAHELLLAVLVRHHRVHTPEGPQGISRGITKAEVRTSTYSWAPAAKRGVVNVPKPE